jgi:hypothetical protein
MSVSAWGEIKRKIGMWKSENEHRTPNQSPLRSYDPAGTQHRTSKLKKILIGPETSQKPRSKNLANGWPSSLQISHSLIASKYENEGQIHV